MDYAETLLDQNRLLADVLTSADLALPVPTCPGWSLLQLLRHVGRGHRWAAQIIREGDIGLDPRQVEGGRPPDDPGGAVDWLRSSADSVVHAVANAGANTAVPTLVGTEPADWWLRRRLHEVTVHRADAAGAQGVAYHLSGELAADGIDEWVGLLVARNAPAGQAPLVVGRSVTFRATEGRSEWSWRLEGTTTGVVLADEPLQCDATVVGPAADLFLAMVRRWPLVQTQPRIDGDPSIWDDWLARTPL